MQFSAKIMPNKTRMHSSRRRTARLLTVSQHALLEGVPAQGVYLPCGVYLPGGVPNYGVYLPRGVPAHRGCTCQGGVSAQVPPPPLWTEWQTGAKILPCPLWKSWIRHCLRPIYTEWSVSKIETFLWYLKCFLWFLFACFIDLFHFRVRFCWVVNGS